MKKRLLLTIVSFLLMFISTNVSAAEARAVSCHGCTSLQMSTRATDVATVGMEIVYVFNQSSKSVKKYEVYTSREDGIPLTITKEAYEVLIEQNIQDTYEIFITQAIQTEQNIIIAPLDFPIRSSAGALLGPSVTYGSVSSFLRELPGGWRLSLKQLLIQLIAVNVPSINFGAFVPSSFKLVIEFPDGSTMGFKVQFSYNVLSNEVEVDPVALDLTATDQDGAPVPRRPSNFAGRTFDNRAGGLNDWVDWARLRGLTVVGSGGNSSTGTMSCFVKSNGVYSCTLHQ